MNLSEFNEFLKSDEQPPIQLNEEIRRRARRLFFLSYGASFCKLALVHFFCGLLTLSFCPQFGLNPFNASPHLPHIFMTYGVWACGLFCGSIFMGSGLLMRPILLSKKDQFFIGARGTSLTLLVSSLLYGSFMIASNSETMINFSLVFFLCWLAGGVILERLSREIFRGINSLGRTSQSQ